MSARLEKLNSMTTQQLQEACTTDDPDGAIFFELERPLEQIAHRCTFLREVKSLTLALCCPR